MPPSGSPYTLGCPASHTLCPSSLSYGCCKSGMGCAVNQCYSTEAKTITTTRIITTTKNGNPTTYETIATTVKIPEAPTVLPTGGSSDDSGNNDQFVFKYFPSAVPKVSPTSAAEDDDGGGSGLSTGALAGIIAGAVAFLIIVLLAAFIIIRHLNKVVATVSSSLQSNSTKSRPPMREFKPTDSEVDVFSVDPLMASPRPTVPRQDSAVDSQLGMGSPTYSSGDPTPSGLAAGAYQSMPESASNSRHTSFDVMSGISYFDGSGQPPRANQQSGIISTAAMNRMSNDSRGAYAHVRHWSNASEGSEGREVGGWNSTPKELEAKIYMPELPHSSSTVASPHEEQGRTSASVSSPGAMARPPLVHQRKRSDQQGRSDALGILTEEMHGFHGPSNHLVGQTVSHRPGTRGTTASGAKERLEKDEERQDNERISIS